MQHEGERLLPFLRFCDISNTKLTAFSTDVLLKRCPSLDTLILKSCPFIKFLIFEEVNDISPEQHEHEIHNFPLTHLDLEGNNSIHLGQQTISRLPGLVYLNVGCVRIDPRVLGWISTYCLSLQTLNLSTNDQLADDIYMKSLTQLTSLTGLSLKNCHKITDVTLGHFLGEQIISEKQAVTSMRKRTLTPAPAGIPSFYLTSLDISRNKNIGDKMIIKLMKAMSSTLTELRIRDCEKIAFKSVLMALISGIAPLLRVVDLYNVGNSAGLQAQEQRIRNFQNHTLVNLYQQIIEKPKILLDCMVHLDIGASEITVLHKHAT